MTTLLLIFIMMMICFFGTLVHNIEDHEKEYQMKFGSLITSFLYVFSYPMVIFLIITFIVVLVKS